MIRSDYTNIKCYFVDLSLLKPLFNSGLKVIIFLALQTECHINITIVTESKDSLLPSKKSWSNGLNKINFWTFGLGTP